MSLVYLEQGINKNSSETDRALFTVDLLYLLEDYTLRSIFMDETSETNYYITPLGKEQLSEAKQYINQVIESKLDIFQEFVDPQTQEVYISEMPFSYIKKAYALLDLENGSD